MVRAWGSTIRQMKTKSKTQRLTIPKEIATDATYRFKPGDRVMVRIQDDGSLRVEKANGDGEK